MAEPGIVLFAVGGRLAACALAEQAAIGQDAPLAVAARFPTLQGLAVEQRAPTQAGGEGSLARWRPTRRRAPAASGMDTSSRLGFRFVFPGVSQHGGVDTAAAVVADPVHGLALVRDFGESVGQDFEALGGTVLAVRQLFGGVGPVGGQAARDGVGGVADEEFEIVARAVSREAGLRLSGCGRARPSGPTAMPSPKVLSRQPRPIMSLNSGQFRKALLAA